MAARSKALILFPLFITILCLSFPATAAATTTTTSSSEVDFLYLTLTWPGTLCNLEKCCMPTTGEPALDFLVEDIKTHNNQTGEIVKNCKKTCQFYVNMMKDYINELYAHWSDLSCPSTTTMTATTTTMTSLHEIMSRERNGMRLSSSSPCNNGLENWKKTWCTYGQCSNLNQHDYMQTALNTSYHVNLLEVLGVNRIGPSSSTRYKLHDIQNALRVNYGLSTHIECVNPWWPIWQPRKSLLSKINFCISKDGKSIISCPFNTETTCHDEVWFYPFTSNMLRPCATDSAGLIKMPTEEYSAT